MNPPSLLQIVERFESLAGKLPSRIQKPVLSELTPLKQLFLQQRPPRFLFCGSTKISLREFIDTLFFSAYSAQASDVLLAIPRWRDISVPKRGTISILDARAVDDSAAVQVQHELSHQGADIIFLLNDGQIAREAEKRDLDDLTRYLAWNKTDEAGTKVIGIIIPPPGQAIAFEEMNLSISRLQLELRSNLVIREHLLDVLSLPSPARDGAPEIPQPEAQRLMSILTRELPNEARMEMIRISRNREAQHQVAQVLVKSTTAICAAIGAQPIPLADLPILTSLQLMMISGIMYVSGRERSLRAAGEFIGALGANVGAAVLLREGTRAILKFFPGWGNVVCGVVAGSATYAIGRAATAFFVEGVSLKDARRTYLTSRKKRPRLALTVANNGARAERMIAPLPDEHWPPE
jgi:uncharacterized protein (DUF697 family)